MYMYVFYYNTPHPFLVLLGHYRASPALVLLKNLLPTFPEHSLQVSVSVNITATKQKRSQKVIQTLHIAHLRINEQNFLPH